MFNNPLLMVVLVVVAIVIFYFLLTLKKERFVKVRHDYFHRLLLFPAGSNHTRWEAELDFNLMGVDKPLGILAENYLEEFPVQAPTEAEIAFCKEILNNLERLFMECKPAIEEAWERWVRTEMPKDWKTVLSLNGFSVPKNGERNQTWGVTYLCKPAGVYFSIQFADGKPHLESVDG